jgi:alkylation response protein AidB-like acyl-CoA dehydrogenase
MTLQTQVRQEATEIAARVDAAPHEEKFRTFFDAVRASQIPFLPCTLQTDAGELYARSYEAFYLLGRASIPLTVGLTMHQYNLAALATLPVPAVPEFERRRQVLVDTIARYRSLMAISSFGENIKSKHDPSRNVLITERPDGTYLCQGRKGFQSIASEADILLFSGVMGDAMAMMYTNLKKQSAVTVGPPLFTGAMAMADTRPVEFNDLVVKRRNLLSGTDDLTDHISFYATAWFEALITAAYLGGACRALDEVRKFALSVHTDDGEPLAELDGFVVEVGRLAIALRGSLAMARSFGICADRYCKGVRAGLAPEELDPLANDLMDCGSIVKYQGTKTATEIVSGARGLIGTRGMASHHPLHAINEQICFGPLHPTIPSLLERSVGSEVLVEEPFTGLFEWGLA